MSSLSMRSIAGALAGASAALWLTPAYPHSVCGDRIFPATLAIDDPEPLSVRQRVQHHISVTVHSIDRAAPCE